MYEVCEEREKEGFLFLLVFVSPVSCGETSAPRREFRHFFLLFPANLDLYLGGKNMEKKIARSPF